MTTITTVAFSPSSFTSPVSQTPSPSEKWFYLVPTITVIALGGMFLPNFAIGLAVGVVKIAATMALTLALRVLGMFKDSEEESEYHRDVQENPLSTTLFGPYLEECIFRGVLLPMIARIALRILPFAAAPFLGTGMLVATAIGIGGSAIAFGAVHAFNPHPNANLQASICTISGIVYGILWANCGLVATIAAHILNNTIVLTLSRAS